MAGPAGGARDASVHKRVRSADSEPRSQDECQPVCFRACTDGLARSRARSRSLVACSAAAAMAAGPPFPDPEDGRAVYDTAEMLSAEAEARLEERIDAIEAETGAEIVVYTQHDPDISEDENLANAGALIDQWGIGRSGFDDGLVLLVGARPGPRREPGQPVRRLGLPWRVRQRGRAHRHHRRLVRAIRPRRRLRRRRAQHDRGDRRAHGTRGPRAPRDAAHPERGARPDRRATGAGGHPRARLAALAARGRRPRADRLAVDPDGGTARRDDAGAGDGHPERDGHRSQHQHHPRRAGEHGPPLVPQPRPGQRGPQRRRPGSAHRPRHRGPCREPGRPRAGQARARGVGTHPGRTPAARDSSPASGCGR